MSQLGLLQMQNRHDSLNIIEISQQQNQVMEKISKFQFAFQDDDLQVDQVSTLGQQSIEQQINTAITILSVQFNHLSTLYQRLITNTLPKQPNYESDLSNPTDSQMEQERRLNPSMPYRKEIDLVSLDQGKQEPKIVQYVSKPHEIDPCYGNPKLQMSVPYEPGQGIKVYSVKLSQFHTNEERSRFIEKRMVAKAFIRKSYGLMNLRRELEETPYSYRFDESRYKTVSYGVVTDTFRRLEFFLKQNQKQFVGRAQKIDMKPLYSVLLNCRQTIPYEFHSFIKFMQAQFNVDCEYVIISKKDAFKLYQRIITHQKVKEFDSIPSFHPKFYQQRPSHRLQEFLKDESSENDEKLLQLYKEERNVAKVRDRYRQIYGPGTQFEDCKVIKSRLNKALRAAIRKIKSIASDLRQFAKYSSFLNSLNNDRIKKILVSPQALEARVSLCDLYIGKKITEQMMDRCVNLLEQAVNRLQKRGKTGFNMYDEYDF